MKLSKWWSFSFICMAEGATSFKKFGSQAVILHTCLQCSRAPWKSTPLGSTFVIFGLPGEHNTRVDSLNWVCVPSWPGSSLGYPCWSWRQENLSGLLWSFCFCCELVLFFSRWAWHLHKNEKMLQWIKSQQSSHFLESTSVSY